METKGSGDPSRNEALHPQAGPLSRNPYLQDTLLSCTYGSSPGRASTDTQGNDRILFKNQSIIMAWREITRSNRLYITGNKSARHKEHIEIRIGSKAAHRPSKNERHILHGLIHKRRRKMSSPYWSLLFAMVLLSNIHLGGAQTPDVVMGERKTRHLSNSTQVPSSSPTSLSSSPTDSPTRSPTKSPTRSPSELPTPFPTNRPSSQPTSSPTISPTTFPTLWPSRGPTSTPSFEPSTWPSSKPTGSPTKLPTNLPSDSPSSSPTSIPSLQPTSLPSFWPTDFPTKLPSSGPSLTPSFEPSLRPSLQPTSGPTESQFPSVSPTQDPSTIPTNAPTTSASPTNIPSVTPSELPTISPSGSIEPSISPTITSIPSPSPSAEPSSVPTNIPSSLPSLRPSNLPTRTNEPSISPSHGPTQSLQPSASSLPTERPSSLPTRVPTSIPTSSPSDHPTSRPTISMRPSESPSSQPTDVPTSSSMPSSVPSMQPTVEPTYADTIVSGSSFTQILIMNKTDIAPNFQLIYKEVMESFTPYFSTRTASGDDRITTVCTIEEVKGGNRRKLSQLQKKRKGSLRRMQSQPNVIIEFFMKWSSQHTNVTGYADLFDKFMDKNSTFVIDKMNEGGIEVNEILVTLIVNPDAPSPVPTETVSLKPSQHPSDLPSYIPSHHPSSTPSVTPTEVPSSKPSNKPSDFPSISPSLAPTLEPSSQPSHHPSVVPSSSPSLEPTSVPSSTPTSAPTKVDNVKAIITWSGVVVGAGAFFVVLGLCVKRKRRNEDRNPRPGMGGGGGGGGNDDDQRQRRRLRLSPRLRPPFGSNFSGPNFSLRFPVRDPSGQEPAPEENDAMSYDSNFMLSTGSSAHDSGSDIEYDETGNLADEFDRYKDQNLEKMRREVQDTLSDVDAMMSQALTNALMDDMDEDEDAVADAVVDPAEVEASVLCEMNDWLKMREGATDDERREFMQERLNDMVSKVRRGVLSPEDGSRIVHGSAAMLGLQLAESLPETTLIVTGMRKKVSKKDMIDAFKEFGELERVAVSSNARGFGFVRYRSPVSCRKAIERFRVGEIVVQDVGVTVSLLN